MVNNCLFLDNAAVSPRVFGGAISADSSKLMVVDSIFKKNKAIATTPVRGLGGAIYADDPDGPDALVLSSVFELNEATNDGGAALFDDDVSSVAWYNNKELLFGNDAGVLCDGVSVVEVECFNVGDNFSI